LKTERTLGEIITYGFVAEPVAWQRVTFSFWAPLPSFGSFGSFGSLGSLSFGSSIGSTGAGGSVGSEVLPWTGSL
jgi:hypothetical protein